MRFVVRAARLAVLSWSAWFETLLTTLPNATPFSMLRVWYRQRRGLSFGKSCFIARNVHFLGIVSMSERGSVSNNCFLSDSSIGIRIGNKAVIAPDCVPVAFDHDYRNLSIPVIDEPSVNTPTTIEDDVWIGANSTLTKGVRLGEGCIVGPHPSPNARWRDADPRAGTLNPVHLVTTIPPDSWPADTLATLYRGRLRMKDALSGLPGARPWRATYPMAANRVSSIRWHMPHSAVV
jgi:hypothetical protein